MAALTQSPTPVSIFIGGTNHQMFASYFHGHISCVLFYDSALDSHVIRAIQLCPSKHGRSLTLYYINKVLKYNMFISAVQETISFPCNSIVMYLTVIYGLSVSSPVVLT